jgi:hypothetical protein
MAQTRRTTTKTTYSRNVDARNTYVYGNTVRKLDVQRQLEEAPRRKLSNETRKNRERAHHMSFAYVTFLVAALCTCAMILMNYIQLQADLTNKTRGIAKMESQLNTLRLANDEEYARITSSLDLEEIKRIAIGELGMTYAEEGQIITYSSVTNDYMRQVANN